MQMTYASESGVALGQYYDCLRPTVPAPPSAIAPTTLATSAPTLQPRGLWSLPPEAPKLPSDVQSGQEVPSAIPPPPLEAPRAFPPTPSSSTALKLSPPPITVVATAP